MFVFHVDPVDEADVDDDSNDVQGRGEVHGRVYSLWRRLNRTIDGLGGGLGVLGGTRWFL